MATIHLEPLPPKCGAGEVLKFIAERGKLDGKAIGKIVFVGRGATVEVPDGNAAAILTAIDGATFREKPIRARFAGAPGNLGSGHFSTLSKLLDLEAAAEESEARRRASLGRDAGDGTTLTGLVLTESEFGLGGRLLLTFSRKSRGTPLPPNRLGPGSPVVLTRAGAAKLSIRGVVYDRAQTTIGIAVEPPDDDLPDDATWRLDLSPDEVSRLRQQDALRRAGAASGDRLAYLRAILLGEKEPDFADQQNLGVLASGGRQPTDSD
jgi:ATP-dependent RNA/DNA helicase IGHMBP2